MVDIGVNEFLEVRESPDGNYFHLWPFGRGPVYGNVYKITTHDVNGHIVAHAPAMPGFVGEGVNEEEAQANLLAEIKAYLYRLKYFLDRAEPLIPRYITPDTHHPTEGSARMLPGDISIWALIAYMRALPPEQDLPGRLDRLIDDAVIKQAAADYDLPLDAVRAAVAYYYRHRQAIDARIEENTSAA